jgi:CheY-like chemotaxis protein
MKAAGTPSLYLCKTARCAGPGARLRTAHQPRRRPSAPRRIAAAAAPPAPAGSVQKLDPVLLYARPGPVPRVLHIDSDSQAALALARLLMPEARVTHVPTLSAARRLLQQELFSLVVIDPSLPDGDAASLLPALARTPLLVYSARQPAWREPAGLYLPKPWTTPRQLWTTISTMLGVAQPSCAGD